MLLSQHGACRPAAWELKLFSLLPLLLFSLSFFSHFLSLFISFYILLPAPFCCFYLLYFPSTELQSSLLSFTPVFFCFLHSSHLLTNRQQLAIAAAEEVQPCVPDQSSTQKPHGSLLMQHNNSEFSIQPAMKQGDGQVEEHGSIADSLSCPNMLGFPTAAQFYSFTL